MLAKWRGLASVLCHVPVLALRECQPPVRAAPTPYTCLLSPDMVWFSFSSSGTGHIS